MCAMLHAMQLANADVEKEDGSLNSISFGIIVQADIFIITLHNQDI